MLTSLKIIRRTILSTPVLPPAAASNTNGYSEHNPPNPPPRRGSFNRGHDVTHVAPDLPQARMSLIEERFARIEGMVMALNK